MGRREESDNRLPPWSDDEARRERKERALEGGNPLPPREDVNALPARKKLPHPPPVEAHNRPIVLFVTVCVVDPTFKLATPESHDHLLTAWARGDQWRVGSYTIMPDHVHFFCVPGVVHPVNIKMWNKFWKGQFRRLAGVNRTIWQRDGWDTQLRDHDHYVEKRSYVRENPVRRGLAAQWQDWPYQGEVHVIEW